MKISVLQNQNPSTIFLKFSSSQSFLKSSYLFSCALIAVLYQKLFDITHQEGETQIVGLVSQMSRIIKAVWETAPTYFDQEPLNLDLRHFQVFYFGKVFG